MKTPRRSTAGMLAALALLASLGLTAAAPAQFGEAAGFGEMMSPYFLRRDLNTFANGLDLDDSQSVIVESLFWDYEDAHEAGKVRMLERLSEMREIMQDMERDQILKLVFQPFEDRSDEWNIAKEQFLENVRLILNNEQLERWGDFRRLLRREKELPKGRFSGESLNLHHVLKEMDLEPSVTAILEPVLEDYDVYLDQALKTREEIFQESRLSMMHSIRDEDPDTALAIHQKQVDSRLAIRKTNDDFIDIIAGTLAEPLGAQFRAAALERGYPRIFRPGAAERLFAQAMQLEDLSPERLQEIVDLEGAFLAELDVINMNLLRLLKEYEPEEAQYRAKSFAVRDQTATKPADPTREQFREREYVGRRYVEMLRALLTPEQFRSLDGAQRFLRARAKGEGGFGQPGGVKNPKERKRALMEEKRRGSVGGRGGP